MANKSGWWTLEIKNEFEEEVELDDTDLGHIAELIKEGYTEGEICKTWDEEDED